MRKEHHPQWVEKLLERYNEAWSRHFLFPQFESVGEDVRVMGAQYVHVQGPNISVGNHVHLFATPQSSVSFAVDPYESAHGRIHIGDYCVISPGARIRSAARVDIGKNCMLAENAFLTDCDWHDVYHRIFPGKRAPITLKDNVWLGDSVTVCKGVTIGENSVIGARSVVTKDVPANAIAAGNPARVVSELDPAMPSSQREHLFNPFHPYQKLKDDYDAKRLAGNSLAGWARARWFPSNKS